MSRPALESTQPPIQWVLGDWGGALSEGVKLPGHEWSWPLSSIVSCVRVSGVSAPHYAFIIYKGTTLLLLLPHTVLWELEWGMHYSYQATVGRSGDRIPVGGNRFFYSLKLTNLTLGTGILFWWVKQPDREGNHSSPFNAKVKVEWSCSSAPSTCLHSVDRENFTITVVEEVEEASSCICI